MRRSLWLAALVGGLVLLTLTESAQAQFSFGMGRGGRGFRGGDRTSWYVDTPYASVGQGRYGRWGGYGWDGYGGYGYGRGWGRRGGTFVDVNLGGSPYYGYGSPYYSGQIYAGSGYYGTPMMSTPYVISDSSYGMPMQMAPGSGTIISSGQVIDSGRGGAYQSFYSAPTRNERQVLVHVTLPTPDAKVFFGDTQTQQMGTHRVFISPELEAGKEYTYRIKATWREGGQEVTREKQIDVKPGSDATVNFGTEGRHEGQDARPGSEARPVDFQDRSRDRDLNRERDQKRSDEGQRPSPTPP